MKRTRFNQMQEQLAKHIGDKKAQSVLKNMEKEYRFLCETFVDKPKAFQRHMHNNIFPVASAFRALMADGMERSEAAELACTTFLELMNAPAEGIRKMLKVPGLYRIVPRLWNTFTPKLFREDAGFRYHFYEVNKDEVKFDMTRCPYHQLCKELDCLELASTFCDTDDICYGNMHPRLIWRRTKTIARGDNVCDFNLYIRK